LNNSDFDKLSEVYYKIHDENINDNNGKLIKKVFKRGKINNEEEFRLLSLFVENSSEKGSVKDSVQKANLLLI
jgi:hypothetical protein